MTLPPGAGEHRPHGDLPPLPAWAKTLQRRIRQRGLDFFILSGPGVRDLHPLGARRFGTMGAFLSEVMLGDRSAIVTYDRGAGGRQRRPAARADPGFPAALLPARARVPA